MKLSEMRDAIAARDLRLTKSLGQNFLHDANQIRRIMEVAELQPSDKVLEIGPGLGPLTEVLLARVSEVLAIEKDARLVAALRERFPPEDPASARLRLIHDDALVYLRRGPNRGGEVSSPVSSTSGSGAEETSPPLPPPVEAREPGDWTGWKLVANLPYSVASPILVELAQNPRGPARIATTIQLEVAQRLVAEAGDEGYGVLTLLVGLGYESCGWFKIPPSCFFPPPDVDSACICFARRRQALLDQALWPDFKRVVKRAFSERRKMMRKLLKCDWPAESVDRALAALAPEVRPDTRAERVSLPQFAQLTKLLKTDPTP